MRLFKYLRAERTDTLRKRCIGFPSPETFNDPFECLPEASLIDDPSWRDRIEKTLVEDLQIDEHFAAALEKRPVRRITPSMAKKLSHAIDALRPELRDVALQTMDEHRKNFRICCLTTAAPESEEGLLLWAHYADNHKGFVIEFDPHHPWFMNFETQGTVTYSPRRCGWIVSNEHPAGIVEGRDLLFTKSERWEYEQEYRIALPRESKLLDASAYDSLTSFPGAAVLSVFLGVSATEQTRNTILSTLRDGTDLGHVKVVAMRPHHVDFRLVPEEI